MKGLKSRVNGNAYDFVNIEFLIAGIGVLGVTDIKYKHNKTWVKNYANGEYMYNRGSGIVEFEGSITLYMNELEALRNASPTGLITDLDSFNVVISFTPKGKLPIVHVLEDCVFMNDGVESSQGSTSVITELNMDIGFIKYKQ